MTVLEEQPFHELAVSGQLEQLSSAVQLLRGRERTELPGRFVDEDRFAARVVEHHADGQLVRERMQRGTIGAGREETVAQLRAEILERQRTRFLEQVRRTGHHSELVRAAQAPCSALVQNHDFIIVAADDQQRGGSHIRQHRLRQVGTAAPRHDCCNALGLSRSRAQCRGGSGARPKQSNGKCTHVVPRGKPLQGAEQAARQESDVETQLELMRIELAFSGGKQVEQECGESGMVQHLRRITVAAAETAASAAVRERDQPVRTLRHGKQSAEKRITQLERDFHRHAFSICHDRAPRGTSRDGMRGERRQTNLPRLKRLGPRAACCVDVSQQRLRKRREVRTPARLRYSCCGPPASFRFPNRPSGCKIVLIDLSQAVSCRRCKDVVFAAPARRRAPFFGAR